MSYPGGACTGLDAGAEPPVGPGLGGNEGAGLFGIVGAGLLGNIGLVDDGIGGGTLACCGLPIAGDNLPVP